MMLDIIVFHIANGHETSSPELGNRMTCEDSWWRLLSTLVSLVIRKATWCTTLFTACCLGSWSTGRGGSSIPKLSRIRLFSQPCTMSRGNSSPWQAWTSGGDNKAHNIRAQANEGKELVEVNILKTQVKIRHWKLQAQKQNVICIEGFQRYIYSKFSKKSLNTFWFAVSWESWNQTPSQICLVEKVCGCFLLHSNKWQPLFGFMLSQCGQDKTAFEITILRDGYFPHSLVLEGNWHSITEGFLKWIFGQKVDLHKSWSCFIPPACLKCLTYLKFRRP